MSTYFLRLAERVLVVFTNVEREEGGEGSNLGATRGSQLEDAKSLTPAER